MVSGRSIEDIFDDDVLIRRFRAEDPYYLLHNKVAPTIFYRNDTLEEHVSVFTERLMQDGMEWCSRNVRKAMKAFGVPASVPRTGYDDVHAMVSHEPSNEAYSHTHVTGLDDLICDMMAEDGVVLDQYPLCNPR